MFRALLFTATVLLLSGCATAPPIGKAEPADKICPVCPVCLACPGVEPVKPPEKPLQAAEWRDLPGWPAADPRLAMEAFKTSCIALDKQPLWRPICLEARGRGGASAEELRAWLEERLRPWQLVNPDGSREGLVTGYYEPVLKGSRSRKKPYLQPVFGPPDDLVVVDLAELYPELKHMRLRGRLEGRRLVPYWSRADWEPQESKRSPEVLLWLDDALDFFFMQIQGSGQVQLDDGTRIRLGYADQNGHPYRSIGKWLVEQGELAADQASMANIKAWARANPKRVQELMNANPSLVFFRELPAEGAGPPGAMGLALTPEYSIAIDPRNVPLGVPVFLDTTLPGETRPLQRLVLAQDTGGAIRGVVRADFYWGSGAAAGAMAGKMRQKGRMWALLPAGYAPK